MSASTMQLARAQQPAPPRFSDAMRYSADRGGASFLVARNGVVLAEDYPGGSPDTRWPIGEGSRVMMTLLLGALVADRLLRLDDPVALTLGGAWSDPTRAVISPRSLINGTSGIAFRPSDTHDLATALTLPLPDATAPASYTGDAAAYFVLAEIARRRLLPYDGATDPAQYLIDRVLGPIGCTPAGFERGSDGAARFDEGCLVSARGWAQVGELIRRVGVWRAEQIVDHGAMEDAVRGSFIEARAGFGLWLDSPATRGAPPLPVATDLWSASAPAPMDLAMAAGAQAQRLYISPSTGTVIVRQTQANAATLPPWSDAAFLTAVWRDLGT